jgi:cysteine desulfurase
MSFDFVTCPFVRIANALKKEKKKCGVPQVYLDHAATTPVRAEVVEAMRPYLEEYFGNPSSFYQQGVVAKKAVDAARETIGEILNVHPNEVLFTSGGTESDNLALLGFARANKDKGMHIITSQIEHHAVLGPAKQLEKEGFTVTYLKPNEEGMISVEQVKEALREDTILVSVIYANNEIGTIQPIADIGNAVQKYRQKNESAFPVMHTDACQATGYLPLDHKVLHVDMMTINGSKMYGPKGVGVLTVRRGLKVQPLVFGGSQERGRRAGTENVAGIVGLATALELTQKKQHTESARQQELRDYLIKEILAQIPHTILNGSKENRLPNNVNISFLGIEGEALLLYLDHAGVAVSTGSACSSQSLDPSHVIVALGYDHERAHSSIRFTLGRRTTKEEIDYTLKVLPEIVEKLRTLSPIKH